MSIIKVKYFQGLVYGFIQNCMLLTVSIIYVYLYIVGPPPAAGKKVPHVDFVEEPHRLLKPLPTFDNKGKLLYPNIEDEEPLNFEN